MDSHTKISDYTDIMLEHMPVGVALYDAQDLRLLAANPLFHTFLDPAWQEGRAIGQPLTDWLPGAEANGIVAILHRVVETGIPLHGEEFSFPTLKRGITYWNWTLNPIRDNYGRIIQLLFTGSEVTAQVLARQKAEQAQASLTQTNRAVEAERKRLEVTEAVARSVRESLDTKSICKAAIDAISANFDATHVYVHIADPVQPALHLLHIHPIPTQELSFRIAQLVPYDSAYPIAQAYKHRNPIIIADLQTAPRAGSIESSNPLLMSGAHGFACVPLWFGDTFEGTLSAIFKENISADGPEVQALVGCSLHIAAALAHARLQEAVEHERAHLHAILDQLPEGILITEAASGSIRYVNAAAAGIFGIPTTSLIGLPVHQHRQVSRVKRLHGRLLPPWNFAVIRALCGEMVSSQEMLVTRPDGSQAVTLSSGAPLRTESGVITGAVIVFQDVTAQKSLEQQKNEFLSIASHELRTPITAIQGFAEILQMNAANGRSFDSPYSLRALAAITEQSACLARLIEELLDQARIEQAQLVLNLAPHNLISTLTHVIETQTTITRQHHLLLALEGLQATDTLMGNFDENRMVQVLNNLISNAIKYSPNGGEIEVGLRLDRPDEALIWVRDPGIGIAVKDLPHIFNRFHRASNLDHSISGLGIGLYLVKELVIRHGGRVWAESTEGYGSTFYVTLPLNRR